MLHNVTHCEHILGDCFICIVLCIFSQLGVVLCICFISWFLRTASYIKQDREKYFIKHSSEEIHAIGYSLVATHCPSLPHKVVTFCPVGFLWQTTIHTIPKEAPKGEKLQSTTVEPRLTDTPQQRTPTI